jgi:alcohol dehydrogenase class IV
VFFGPGSIGALRALNASKAALLVSRSLLADEDTAPLIRKSVGALDLLTLQAPIGETNLQRLDPIIGELSEFRPDWIVAVGGGSVLDSGKVVWAFYEHPDADLELITRPFALPALRGRARFAAVPTTAGTGSEVSSSAVVFDERVGQKRFLVSHELLPDLAILDPALTTKVPPRSVASSGLDALAHAIEGYVSKFANPFVDLMAEKAAAVIFQTLPKSLEEPSNLEARLLMMEAAMLAGWVQNLKIPGIGHALAHQMASFGVPHGMASGAFLAPSITANCSDPAVREKYRRLARSLDLDGEGHLIERIHELRRAIDVAQPLSAGMPGGAEAFAGKVKELERHVLADPCARANPVPVTPEMIQAMALAVA